MTEKEKMLNSQMYNPMGDKQLRNERCSVKNLCREYNNLPFEDEETQKILIKKIVGSTKENFYITAPFWCDYGYNISIGEGSFVNFDCVFLDLAPIRIGRNTLIGPKVQLLTPHHPLDPAQRATGREAGKPITIGDNCWLGGGVIVCPGVRIGDGAIIGAGSVVTRDIPANSVAVGNPARVTRTLSHT